MVDPDGTSAFDAIQHCEKFIEVNLMRSCSLYILILRYSVLAKQAISSFAMDLWYALVAPIFAAAKFIHPRLILYHW
jgi:hypothetical protein